MLRNRFRPPLTGRQLADGNLPGGRDLPQRRLEGPGVHLERGSVRHSGATRCSPVSGVLTCEQPVYRRLLSDALEPHAFS
jgi:hypothetical protein